MQAKTENFDALNKVFRVSIKTDLVDVLGIYQTRFYLKTVT